MAYSRFFLVEDLKLTLGEREAARSDEVALPLSSEDLHHAVSVLRATTAEKIAVVEPSGEVFVVTLTQCSKHGLSGRVIDRIDVAEIPPLTLVQGVSRGERMDLCIRMAVEVGADEIAPVLVSRCEIKLDEKKRASKQERWERIAHAAAKQSGRTKVPTVKAPLELDVLLDESASQWDLIIVAWEEDLDGSLHDLITEANLSPNDRVALVIGPEGGLTPEEVEQLKAHGAQTCTLGDTILRTETAGVVGSSLVLYERGALGGMR